MEERRSGTQSFPGSTHRAEQGQEVMSLDMPDFLLDCVACHVTTDSVGHADHYSKHSHTAEDDVSLEAMCVCEIYSDQHTA